MRTVRNSESSPKARAELSAGDKVGVVEVVTKDGTVSGALGDTASIAQGGVKDDESAADGTEDKAEIGTKERAQNGSGNGASDDADDAGNTATLMSYNEFVETVFELCDAHATHEHRCYP